jgi:ElaB/YqjD/DUF883 family membrane-anchored ribosome-binding protein
MNRKPHPDTIPFNIRQPISKFMKNDTATATHSPKELLDELKVLVTEAETMISSSLSEPSPDALEALHARFHAAHERFSDFYVGARKQVIAGAKSTDVAIRDNPYQAMAIALGVGALLGSLTGTLLGRRSA